MSIGSPSAADAIKDTCANAASLKAHNDSFDQLLRHIPAQYYFLSNDQIPNHDKLSKSQKQALKKQAEKPQAKQAKADKRKEDRIARYDPNEPHTIPEILSIKANQRAKKDDSDSGTSDDEQGASGDDSDNAWQDAEDSPNDTDLDDSDSDDGIVGDNDNDELSVPTLAPRDPSAPVPTVSALREKLRKRIGEIQAMKRSKSSPSSKEGGEVAEAQVKSKDDLLDERRRRGALRDNRRKKRKEERKQQAQSGEGQKRKKEERGTSNGRKGGGKANAPGRIEAEEHDEDSRPAKKGKTSSSQALVASTSATIERPPADAFTFSNLDFTNSQLAVAQATVMAGSTSSKVHKLTTKKNRHDLPKDANAALAILEKRKEKLATLTDEQKEKVQDKEKWEKAGLRAEGEKVRDDEKRLKKMAKRQERQKAKSAKAWAERKETVKDGIAAKVAKRNMNLAAREKQRKDKKMGIKTKSGAAPTRKTKSKNHAGRNKTGRGRPGFEGKGKKK
ncbi:BQ2448_4810 [Microbotryum intermedium]|uniref:BQ2448_4810 protein n=1 Tax=Microbotryum intermedium TaxID=269621 RepID=A0A238FM10_9BASI|nr:BQ2448_4810 [Microbotryum intermedium]